MVQKVKEMTGGEVLLSPGTMYGSLSKMEKDGVISFVREEEKRKIYVITQLTRGQFTAGGRAASFIKGIFAALLVLYLVIFAQTAIGYQRLKKKLER